MSDYLNFPIFCFNNYLTPIPCTLGWNLSISEFAAVKTANFSESYESFVLTILLRTPMFSPQNGFVLFLTESSGGLKFHEKKEN